MVVALRKRQVECCEKLASDLAAAKKRFTKTNHSHDEASYEKLLISTTITLERKKALLLKELRSLFIVLQWSSTVLSLMIKKALSRYSMYFLTASKARSSMEGNMFILHDFFRKNAHILGVFQKGKLLCASS